MNPKEVEYKRMLLENTDVLIEICSNVFSKSREYCLYFVGPVFFTRVFWLNISGANQSEYSALIKGLLTFFVLSYSFEYILDIIFEIPRSIDLSRSAINATPPNEEVAWVPDVLRWTVQTLHMIFYHLAHFLQFLFLVFLSAIAPIVFLLSCLLNIGFGLTVFFGILLVTGCWPIVWISFDQVSVLIAQMDLSWLGYSLTEILINLMKAVGPLGLALVAFSSESGKALRTGISGTRAMSMKSYSVSKNSVKYGKNLYDTKLKKSAAVKAEKPTDKKHWWGKKYVNGKRNERGPQK